MDRIIGDRRNRVKHNEVLILNHYEYVSWSRETGGIIKSRFGRLKYRSNIDQVNRGEFCCIPNFSSEIGRNYPCDFLNAEYFHPKMEWRNLWRTVSNNSCGDVWFSGLIEPGSGISTARDLRGKCLRQYLLFERRMRVCAANTSCGWIFRTHAGILHKRGGWKVI